MRILTVAKTAGRWLLELAALVFVLTVAGLLLLIALMPEAHAAGTTARLTWSHATTLIDGTPLPLASIKETLIEWRRTAGGPIVGSLRVAAPAAQVDVPGLVCGDFVFTGYTVTTTNLQSNASNAAPYQTGVTCIPNPPAGLSAN